MQLRYSNPELSWLEQVAKVRSTAHNYTGAHNSSRFFPILPKMGYIGIQKMLAKYAVLEVCSCQINVCRLEDLVCRFKFVDSVCRYGL